jgi:hypothetical protein
LQFLSLSEGARVENRTRDPLADTRVDIELNRAANAIISFKIDPISARVVHLPKRWTKPDGAAEVRHIGY